MFHFAWGKTQSSLQDVVGVVGDLCNELLYSYYNPKLMHYCCGHEGIAGHFGFKYMTPKLKV